MCGKLQKRRVIKKMLVPLEQVIALWEYSHRSVVIATDLCYGTLFEDFLLYYYNRDISKSTTRFYEILTEQVSKQA